MFDDDGRFGMESADQRQTERIVLTVRLLDILLNKEMVGVGRIDAVDAHSHRCCATKILPTYLYFITYIFFSYLTLMALIPCKRPPGHFSLFIELSALHISGPCAFFFIYQARLAVPANSSHQHVCVHIINYARDEFHNFCGGYFSGSSKIQS